MQPIQSFSKHILSWLLPSLFAGADNTPDERAHRVSLRHRAIFIAFSLTAVLLLSRYLHRIILWVFALFGASEQLVYRMITNSAVLQSMQIVFSFLAFTVPFVIAAAVSRHRVSRLIPFGKPQKGTAVSLFLIGIAFCAFANIAVSLGGGVMDFIFRFFSDGMDYTVADGAQPHGLLGFILTAIATAVMPALAEEFAFRGIVYGMLEGYGEGFAVISTAILFGLMHGNFVQIPFAFLVGLVLGFIRAKTQSIWICFAVHGFNNLIAVTNDYTRLPPAVENVVYTLFLALCLLAGLVAVIWNSNPKTSDKSDFYTLRAGETTLCTGRKYAVLFTDPLILAFIAFCTYESMGYFS